MICQEPTCSNPAIGKYCRACGQARRKLSNTNGVITDRQRKRLASGKKEGKPSDYQHRSVSQEEQANANARRRLEDMRIAREMEI